MKKDELELYTDYLIVNSGYATATGLSAMLDGELSHDKVTGFLSERDYTSKDLWKEVKGVVREFGSALSMLIRVTLRFNLYEACHGPNVDPLSSLFC